ncbi:MAG: hypothetical protein DMF82_13450 [Acidobacteria bacterium]|nr:MAG: hypothetical protein DMF82_13450 [Acidobacteriota bacterium]
MTVARTGHTATLLPNGKVLVTGGFGALASAELYDPATGMWTPTGSMATGRTGHTATLLTEGKVLVAGGEDIFQQAFSSAELYEPGTGLWSTTGSMTSARSNHTATLLPNGAVLVAAGYQNSYYSALSTAELYDPSRGLWATTGSLAAARFAHTATRPVVGDVGHDGLAHQRPLVSHRYASAERLRAGGWRWDFLGGAVRSASRGGPGDQQKRPPDDGVAGPDGHLHDHRQQRGPDRGQRRHGDRHGAGSVHGSHMDVRGRGRSHVHGGSRQRQHQRHCGPAGRRDGDLHSYRSGRRQRAEPEQHRHDHPSPAHVRPEHGRQLRDRHRPAGVQRGEGARTRRPSRRT